MAAIMLPLAAGFAQTATPPITKSTAPYKFSTSAASEAANLASSGLGDDVVLAFIGQSHTYFNLSASDIVALKDAGVSSQGVTAMLNHDAALRAQQPVPTPASAPPPTASQVYAPSAPTDAPSAGTTVIVQPPQPPPQVEVVPVNPGPGYVWTPGSWSWNGGAWIWLGGSWRYPSRPGHVWVGGYWGGHGRNSFWVAGHWR